MSTVLAMMAKGNPEGVLRAIDSAKHLVDSVCLVVAPGDPLLSLQLPLSGRIVEEPWQGHAATRTRTLRIAEEDPNVEWILMLDADDSFAPGASLPSPEALKKLDALSIVIEWIGGKPGYGRPRPRWRWQRLGHVTRARIGAHFVGTGTTGLHETLILPAGARTEKWNKIVAPMVTSSATGRSYEEDAKRLGESIKETEKRREMPDGRNAFYYAQSLKDAGKHDEAYVAFHDCARIASTWIEDRFWARLWMGKLEPFTKGANFYRRLMDFSKAHDLCPHRAEALREMARVHLCMGDVDGYAAVSQMADAQDYPLDAMSFVDVSTYSKRALEKAGIPVLED